MLITLDWVSELFRLLYILIFCLVFLSVPERGLTFPNMIAYLFILPLVLSVFMYWYLGVLVFRYLQILFCCLKEMAPLLWWNVPFYLQEYSLSNIILFCLILLQLNSVLFDIIVALAFLWLAFVWHIFISSFPHLWLVFAWHISITSFGFICIY